MNGYSVALMALIAITAAWCWRHRWQQRAVSIGAAVIAVCAVAAFPPWRDALAGTFGSGVGMIALIVLAAFGFGSYVVDHLKHHQPVRTPALGLIGGTAAVMVFAMRSELAHQGSKLAPKTSQALSQASAQIASGQAAHAETASTRLMIIALAVLCFVILIAFMHKDHKKRPYPKASTSLALPAGGGGRALPAGGGGQGGGRKPWYKRLFSGD